MRRHWSALLVALLLLRCNGAAVLRSIRGIFTEKDIALPAGCAP